MFAVLTVSSVSSSWLIVAFFFKFFVVPRRPWVVPVHMIRNVQEFRTFHVERQPHVSTQSQIMLHSITLNRSAPNLAYYTYSYGCRLSMAHSLTRGLLVKSKNTSKALREKCWLPAIYALFAVVGHGEDVTFLYQFSQTNIPLSRLFVAFLFPHSPRAVPNV
jgi:hypothetical protein